MSATTATPALHIGEGLDLPPEAVTETFAILSKRGMGKTTTAVVMAEEMLAAGHQVVIVDPVGVWWGLRADAAGQPAGLPIAILGGEHGDLPLTPTSGSIIADLVVEEQASVVIDLSGFRKGEMTRFMTDFLETLYRRNRAPLHLILDEADAVAPQRPMKGQERMLGAAEDIVRRGRARGLGVTLITQRPAVLNKDVLTQAEVLVVLRTIAPQDRAAIDEWVRVHGTPEQRTELMASLPSLDVAEAWFWSPGWLDTFQRVRVRPRRTFDSSATPKVGRQTRPAAHLTPIDLDRLRERMAQTVEQAEGDDPRVLRRRIAELERAQVARPVAEPERVEVEVPVLDEHEVGRLESVLRQMTDLAGSLTATVRDVSAKLDEVRRPTPTAPSPARRSAHLAGRLVRTPAVREAPASVALDGETHPVLRAGERRMLAVMMRYGPLDRRALGVLSGFVATGGTFGTYLGTLRRLELIEEAGGQITATPMARVVLVPQPDDAPASADEVLDLWRPNLRAGERAMLDELVRAYPAAVSRDELGERTGYVASGGTFGTYIGTLRRIGLATLDGGLVRAAEVLFLPGARGQS